MPLELTSRRRICFITGTRAEYGLMRTTLEAIRSHPRLQLQIIATGMHTDRARGFSLKQIRDDGFTVDRIVAWPGGEGSPLETAKRTGTAMMRIANALSELKSDVALVVGDRVEAFAGASAAAISGLVVAHVHGGDRAQGQLDDSLRHAITKLSHVHFAATQQSRDRILKMGEHAKHVHRVGAPGIDGIQLVATSTQQIADTFKVRRREFALVAYHPATTGDDLEHEIALRLASEVQRTGLKKGIIVCPNNDPGSSGIMQGWSELKLSGDPFWTIMPNARREDFLGLMRDAAVLVGNSSSGIIEAASFSTPVVDVGPRQTGRERSENVIHADGSLRSIRRALREALTKPRRRVANVYGGNGTGRRIASILARTRIDGPLRHKIISY